MIADQVVPWPAEAAEFYRQAGCWRGRPLGSHLWRWARRWGDRVAVVDGERRLTYQDLATRADSLAAGFARTGLRAGDSALIQLPNCWEFVVALFACLRLGVVPVMMLPAHREYELGSIGAHVRAKALIVPASWRGYDHGALARRVAGQLPQTAHVIVVGGQPGHSGQGSIGLAGLLDQGDDLEGRRRWLDENAPDASQPALFLLSGGTTGVPKVISRTHDDYEYNAMRASQACGFGPDTVYLVALPASHNFPLANPGILGTLLCGGQVVLVPSPRPEQVLQAIAAHGVTATAAVPAVAVEWMREAALGSYDLSALRYVHVGGSVLSAEVAGRIGPALSCRLQQVYGMAEGLVCFTPIDADDDVANTTQGRPISPYDELLVLDAQGQPVPSGQIGELLTKGPYTPRGYYGVPQVNARAYTSDGWYRTGDLVQITAQRNVVVRGRVKDLVNRGGEKVSAAEIEDLAQRLPQVAEAMVVATPDPLTGERVCLCVRLNQGCELTIDDVRLALGEQGIAAFKIPERLEIFDSLPRTAIGKPDKKRLLDLIGRTAGQHQG
jgi:2,3-dihydroxybenzoate-AMP ligase